MIKKSLIAGMVAFSVTTAWAGPPVVDQNTAIIEEEGGLEANISVGYDSDYIFRGVKFAENSVWGQVDAAFDLTSSISLDFGTWYESSASDQYDELNLWAGLSTSVGPVDVAAGYLWYYFPSVGTGETGDTHEVFYALSTEAAGLSLTFLHAYDFVPDGHYFSAEIGKSFEICDGTSLELAAGISYNVDYFVDDSGWNNVDLRAGLPITLAPSVTLTPYIAYSHALEVLEDIDEDDHLYGGVSLSVSF